MKTSTAAAGFAAALALITGSAAQAESTPSTTLELGYTRAQTTGTNPNYGFNTVEIRGGYQFNKNVGAEMEAGFGVAPDHVTVQGIGVDVKQDWEYGLFLDGFLPVGANADLIGRVGYSATQLTASAGGFSAAGQGHGAAVGVGFRQFPGGGKNGWRVDYTHHFYNAGSSADSFGVAYVRRF